jgi:RND family efflux transporter MFP subunit
MARRFADKDPEIFSRVEIIESRIDERLAAEKLQQAEERKRSENDLAESDRALLAIEGKAAAARVERARSSLGALEVRAPHDGIVVLLRDWTGNTLQVGNTTYSGRAVAELPALDRMEAAVYVLEADAGGLKEGSAATVVVEGKPGRSIPATIERVDRMPKPRLRGIPLQYFEATLALELELERTDPGTLKPGARVRASLVLDDLGDVLAVPRQAVFDDGEGSYVYRRKGDGFEKAAVTLGAASLGRIVIESGLAEGDVIAARDPGRSPSELLADDEPEGVGAGK